MSYVYSFGGSMFSTSVSCIFILNKTGTAVNKVKSLLKSWQAFAGIHAKATSSGHWENVRLTNNIKKLTKMVQV